MRAPWALGWVRKELSGIVTTHFVYIDIVCSSGWAVARAMLRVLLWAGGASFPPWWDAHSDATAACEGVAVRADQPDEGLFAESGAEADPDDSESAPAWRDGQSDESGMYFQCSPFGLPVALRPPDLVIEECTCPARGLLGGCERP